jgi:hypothetical protein
MRHLTWLILLPLLAPAVRAQDNTIPLSERDTRADARQLIGAMKTAYTGLKSFSAVVTRQACGPADEVEHVDSGRWNIEWAPDRNGAPRLAVDTILAAPPQGEPTLFGDTPGPLTAIYDGKSGVVLLADKRVYELKVKPEEGALGPWNAAEKATRGDFSVASLLNGSNPVQDFPIPLRELRIGLPQFVDDALCDVVIARFNDNAAQPSRWTMTLFIDQQAHLLRQVITTGTRWDGRERLQIEHITDIKLDPNLPGNTFRLPKVTERPADAEPAKAPIPEEPKPGPAPRRRIRPGTK